MMTKSYGLLWSLNENDTEKAVEQVNEYIKKMVILTIINIAILCVISISLQVFAVSMGAEVLGVFTMGMLISLIWLGIIRIADAYRIIRCLEVKDTLI